MTYERQGPPKPLGHKPAKAHMPGHRGPGRFALRLAEVVRVDYERMNCDLRFLHVSAPAREVPITSAFWSKRGFLGAMPEKGSVAVCGFADVHEGDGIRPYILAFLPNGFLTAMRYHPFGTVEREAEDVGDRTLEDLQRDLEDLYGPTRHKMRKLYPGDIFAMSSKGAEMLIDRDVHLFDRSGGELWLRSEDQILLMSSLDRRMRTGAARRASGRVLRSDLFLPPDLMTGDGTVSEQHPLFRDLVDAGLILEDGNPAPDVGKVPSFTTSSGRRIGVVTQGHSHPDDRNARVYTEDRFEIQQFSDQILPSADIGFDADVIGGDHFDPFIERVYGTIVGNDPYTLGGRSRYGEVLKPSLFASPDDTVGQPKLEILGESKRSESAAAAFLYRMRRPDGLGELFVSHDKEGRVYFSIPASTNRGSGVGAGRSLDADFKGAVKMTMGADRARNESLAVDSDGGWRLTIGSMARSRRAVEGRLRGGLMLDISRADADGRAVDLRTQGDVALAIDGSEQARYTGDVIEEVGGARVITSESMSFSVGTGDMNTTVAGKVQENIKGSRSQAIGSGREATIFKALTGDTVADKLKIVMGGRKETFVAPAQDERVFMAAGERTVRANGALSASWTAGLAGDFSFEASSGSFSVLLGGGSISLSTGGTATISAGTSVQVTSESIGLNGAVGLGMGMAAPNPVVTGVPGPSPYVDPITGIPATGNPLVRGP